MKNLKIFEEFNITEENASDLLYRLNRSSSPIKCSINSDGSFDVDVDLNLYSRNLDKIPIKLNRVNGLFFCHDNKLTNLENCPKIVEGSFACSGNKLITLIGGPKIVKGDKYYCMQNNLKDFYGFPENFTGEIFFGKNPVYEVVKDIINYDQVKFIQLLNDYNVIRNGDTIILDRLDEALNGLGFPQYKKIFSFYKIV